MRSHFAYYFGPTIPPRLTGRWEYQFSEASFALGANLTVIEGGHEEDAPRHCPWKTGWEAILRARISQIEYEAEKIILGTSDAGLRVFRSSRKDTRKNQDSLNSEDSTTVNNRDHKLQRGSSSYKLIRRI
jgi:hypothetical protein